MISLLIVKFAQIRSERFVQLYPLQFSMVVLYYNQKERNNKPDSRKRGQANEELQGYNQDKQHDTRIRSKR